MVEECFRSGWGSALGMLQESSLKQTLVTSLYFAIFSNSKLNKKAIDAIQLFQCNTTTQYDPTYSNTPRGAQGKQPLCANLLRTTLNTAKL